MEVGDLLSETCAPEDLKVSLLHYILNHSISVKSSGVSETQGNSSSSKIIALIVFEVTRTMHWDDSSLYDSVITFTITVHGQHSTYYQSGLCVPALSLLFRHYLRISRAAAWLAWLSPWLHHVNVLHCYSFHTSLQPAPHLISSCSRFLCIYLALSSPS